MAKITLGTLFLMLAQNVAGSIGENLRDNIINRGLDIVLDPIQISVEGFFGALRGNEDALRIFKQLLDESVGSLQAKAREADVHIDRLAELAGQTELTSAQQREQQNIIDILNGKFPGLNATIDDCTETLRRNLDAWMKNTQVDIYGDAQAELLRGRAQAELELRDASALVEEITRKRTEATIKHTEAQREARNGCSAAADEANNLWLQINALTGELKDATAQQEAANATFLEYDSALAQVNLMLERSTLQAGMFGKKTNDLEKDVNNLTDTMDTMSDVGTSSTDALGDGFSTVGDVGTQSMDALVSAISGGETAVIAAVDSIVEGVSNSFDQMQAHATTTSQDMMLDIHTAITTAGQPLEAATERVKTGILGVLAPFPTAMKNLMNSAMDGMRRAMEAARPDLIRRAQEIATAIQQTIQRAFQINSPSRVMVRLFGKVMDGMYVGMDKGEDAVVEKSDDVAERIRLAFETDGPKMEKLMAQLKASFDHGFIDPKFIIPPSGFGTGRGGGGPTYYINNTVNATSPKPLSEYELAREVENLTERMKWKLK